MRLCLAPVVLAVSFTAMEMSAFADAARGMFAARVENGALTGFAGGEVMRVAALGFTLELDAPADIALTKMGGEWHGVWQTPDLSAPVPAALLKITSRWVKLRGIEPPAVRRQTTN